MWGGLDWHGEGSTGVGRGVIVWVGVESFLDLNGFGSEGLLSDGLEWRRLIWTGLKWRGMESFLDLVGIE